jgi:hypothetical protein
MPWSRRVRSNAAHQARPETDDKQNHQHEYHRAADRASSAITSTTALQKISEQAQPKGEQHHADQEPHDTPDKAIHRPTAS